MKILLTGCTLRPNTSLAQSPHVLDLLSALHVLGATTVHVLQYKYDIGVQHTANTVYTDDVSLEQYDMLLILTQHPFATDKYESRRNAYLAVMHLANRLGMPILYLLCDLRPHTTQFMHDLVEAGIEYVLAGDFDMGPYLDSLGLGGKIQCQRVRYCRGWLQQIGRPAQTYCTNEWQYDFLLAAVNPDEQVSALVNKYLRHSLLDVGGIGKTEPLLNSITNNKLVGYAELEQLMLKSICTLFTLAKPHVEFKLWHTTRLAQGLYWNNYMLIPVELEQIAYKLFGIDASYFVVHDTTDLIAKLDKFRHSPEYRAKIKELCIKAILTMH